MRQIVPAPPVPGADLTTAEPEAADESAQPDESGATEPVPTEPTAGDSSDERDERDERVEPPATAALAALAALAELEELGGDLDDLDPDDLDRSEQDEPEQDQPEQDQPELDEPADVEDEIREDRDEAAADQEQPGADIPTVPWPGILVLHGSGTGLVAQRLAARLTRAAVVRTDLFDRAVRGTAGRPDPSLRQRIAVSVVQGYAATGHPVILHGASSRSEHEDLVAAISGSGLAPVQLVEIAEGEDYGEVARRLIESD
jgi:hypothetical protein